jgi:hypothetical protein
MSKGAKSREGCGTNTGLVFQKLTFTVASPVSFFFFPFLVGLNFGLGTSATPLQPFFTVVAK